MPITTPKSKAAVTVRASEFLVRHDFVFRPRKVDGFSHKMIGDMPVTTVNYQSYTEEIPDPDRVLYDYLTRRFHPTPPDEPS